MADTPRPTPLTVEALDAISDEQIAKATVSTGGVFVTTTAIVRALIANGTLVTADRARERERKAVEQGVVFERSQPPFPSSFSAWRDREYPSLLPPEPKPSRTITTSEGMEYRRLAGKWQFAHNDSWCAGIGPTCRTLADAEAVAALLREEQEAGQ